MEKRVSLMCECDDGEVKEIYRTENNKDNERKKLGEQFKYVWIQEEQVGDVACYSLYRALGDCDSVDTTDRAQDVTCNVADRVGCVCINLKSGSLIEKRHASKEIDKQIFEECFHGLLGRLQIEGAPF